MNIDRAYEEKVRVTLRANQPFSETIQTTRREIHKKSDINRVGVIDPDGFRHPTPWSMDYADGDYVCLGFSDYLHTGIRWQIKGPQLFGGTWPAFQPVPAYLKAQAEMACMKKLRDPKINLPMTIGERKQTANLIWDTCKKVGGAYKLFRQKQYKQAAKMLGISLPGARDNWLAYRYGWVPLIGDIYTLCEEINKKDRDDPKRLRTKVSAERLEETTTRKFAGGTYYQTQETTLTWYRAFARFDFGPPKDWQDRLKTLDDWGILNPALVAWELTPFSFVADWFVPVGNYLSSLGYVPFSFRGGSMTEFTTRTMICQGTGKKGAAYISNPVVSAYQRAQSKRFRRHVYASWPFPHPSGALHSDGVRVASHLIAKRVIDAIALLSGTKLVR